MGNDRALLLDQCLDALAHGQTIEECLARHPEAARELAPMLRMAVMLRDLPQPEPRREALQAALIRVGLALPKHRTRRLRHATPGIRWWSWPDSLILRWASALAFSAVVIVGLGAASARSEPGSLLYPLKLVTERVSFALTTDPQNRAELRLTFADRRLSELMRNAQSTGKVDPETLRRLLQEAELALRTAQPLPVDRFKLFLNKLDSFNTYQKAALTQLDARARGDDARLLERAISLCDERDRWMEGRMRAPPPARGAERCWDSSCSW